MLTRSDIPDWCLKRPKPSLQAAYDLLFAPLRMMLIPDRACERLGLTSLRGERFAVVLPELHGRVLDIGAGDNALVTIYRKSSADPAARHSVGVDVVDWGADCIIVERTDTLPFPDSSFDTVSFVACINHIPERAGALAEAFRVLRPAGRVVITMIGPVIGRVGHALWWYSEDKHRHVADGERMGMSPASVLGLLRQAGFVRPETRRFVYGLNHLFVAQKATGR